MHALQWQMVEFVGMRHAGAIVPATSFDLEQLDGISQDRPGRVRFIFARSVLRNRWYRKLVSIAAEGIGMHHGVLHAELKWKCGLIRHLITSKEFGVAVELESTAFNAMDDTRFGRFIDQAIEVLFIDYLPGVDREEVFKQVADFVGPRPA